MAKDKKRKISKMEEEKMISNVNIPDTIIEDILSRLPAKSLGRFRCVSKSWNILLRDPHFVHMHVNRSKQSATNMKVMASSDDPSSLHVSLDHPDFSLDIRFCNVRVYGSCNGLLLLCQGKITVDKKMWLLNPTTGECKTVPDPASEYIDGEFTSIVRYGFCYSESSKDYKIVRIRSYDDDGGMSIPAEVTIYSLSNNSWKKVHASGDKDTPYINSAILHSTGVLVKGNLHWIAEYLDYYEKYKVIAFDIERECFRDVLYPPSFDDSQWLEVSSLDDKLCLLRLSESKWQIWVMREYGLVDSWVEMFSIKSEVLYHTENDNTIHLLCLTNQGEDVLLRNEDDLCLYNIKTERMQHVFHFRSSKCDHYRAIHYTESLLPLGK